MTTVCVLCTVRNVGVTICSVDRRFIAIVWMRHWTQA